MSLRLEKSILRKHKSATRPEKKFNILLVDDEQENLDALSLVLDKEYNLFFANDGEEALTLIEGFDNPGDIHMIVSDQRMPNMTGVGLFKQTSELVPNAVRIILTGYTDVEAAIASINEGHIYKFLTKPIDPIDLRNTVRGGLALRIESGEETKEIVDLKKRVAEVENVANMFERFVPHQLASRIAIEGIQNIKFGQAETDNVTVLFVDIRSFSTYAQSMAPQELLNFLNQCFKCLGEAVHDHSGFVDKYIGDSIMAVFNSTSTAKKDQENNAVQAAIAMQQSIRDLNMSWGKSGQSLIKIGIGIHTGPVVIGTVGMEKRMDITVLGDCVNIAAHLEHLNEVYGSSIIVTEETLKLLTETNGFSYRELDHLSVKGKKDPIRIYEIMEQQSTAQHDQNKLLSQYGKALAAFHSGKWLEASQEFEHCLDIHSADKPSQLYLQRCEDALAAEMPSGIVKVKPDLH